MVSIYGIYHFVHAHEQVYSPLPHLIWDDKDLYAIPILGNYITIGKFIPILGGFHQLRAIPKILYKRYQFMGYKDWFVDSEIIAPGSAEQGFEGRHYFRSMRLHMEAFAASAQIKVESLIKNIDPLPLSKLIELRKSPSPALVKEIIRLDVFEEIKQHTVSTTGTVLNLK